MSSKMYCYVCNQYFSFMGWANHVRMEKKNYGDDIYIKLKLERKNKEQQDKPTYKIRMLKYSTNKRIDDYL